MAGPKIEVWLDCNSFYSRFALQHLRKYSKQLASNGVEWEVHPVFINGINAASGNRPPWMLPAKAKHGRFDGERAAKYFGNTVPMKPPKNFPLKTTQTLRSMCFVKANFPPEKFHVAFLELWTAIWEQQIDIGDPEQLTQVLKRNFTDDEVAKILDASQQQQWKDQLSDNTKAAVDKGAYGAPWFWVRNSKGKEEPFFGSDRFHYMWDYLDIPHKDFEVLNKSSAKL